MRIVSGLTFLALGLILVPLQLAHTAVNTVDFCALTDSMPMSGQAGPPGFEVEIARELAASLNREANFVWSAPFSGDIEQAMAEDHCDVIMGALADSGTLAGSPLENVTLTRPYYAAAYQILRHPEAAPLPTLEDAKEKRIAVESVSIVTYTLRQRGQRVHVMYEAEDVIDAVASGEVQYGYLWGPIAAWRVRERQDVILAPEFQPVDQWSFALAVQEDEGPLYQALDEALSVLVETGKVEEIFAKYSLPYLRPSP